MASEEKNSLNLILSKLDEIRERDVDSRLLEKDAEIERLQSRISEMETELELKTSRLLELESERETKLKNLLDEFQRGYIPAKPTVVTDKLLHGKVDQLVRIFAESSENQKRILKILSKRSLPEKLRSNETCENSEPPSKRVKIGSDSDSSSSWGNGLCLIGDEVWNCFREFDYPKQCKRFSHFRIVTKDGQTVFRMFDEKRGQILIPLPTSKCHKFAISLGTQDLRESVFMTLKDGSLEEVRKRNYDILRQRALNLKAMITKILSNNDHPTISVTLLIPPTPEDRVELHEHWAEVVLETMKSIPFPKIKIINLPNIMKRTRSEFADDSEFRKNWFGGTSTKLASYGARRLFEELKKAITAQHPSILGMAGDWPVETLNNVDTTNNNITTATITTTTTTTTTTQNGHLVFSKCARCTRPQHGSDACRAIDKVCRRCGIIGHFVEVHDVTDPKFRENIIQTLGLDIYELNIKNDLTLRSKPLRVSTAALPLPNDML